MLNNATNSQQDQSLVKLYDMNGKNTPATTSLKIAEFTERNHQHVLRDIKKLTESRRFSQSNFGQSEYIDNSGKVQPMFILDKKFASILLMRMDGEKALEWQISFFDAFEAMEKELLNQRDPVLEFFRPHILEMPSEWTKRFYDDFYKGIYKIYKIKQKGHNHPGFFGWFTNHYIYNVLCKSNGKLLQLLKEKNPMVEGEGNLTHRKTKHHQYLDAIGIVNLQAHVSKVTALLQAAINKRDFEDMFSRVFHSNDLMLECFPAGNPQINGLYS